MNLLIHKLMLVKKVQTLLTEERNNSMKGLIDIKNEYNERFRYLIYL